MRVQIRKKRIISVVLCIVFAMMLASLCLEAGVLSQHNCCGEKCEICVLLHASAMLWQSVPLLIAMLTCCSAAAMFVKALIHSSRHSGSPVGLKVRLLI